MPRLTKKLADATPITGKDYIVFDDQMPGFGLRVLPSGKKMYIVQYRHIKRVRRMIIGRHSVFDHDEARAHAKGLLLAVGKGEDPAGKKMSDAASPTVRDLAKRYENEHAKLYLKPTSQKVNQSVIDNHIVPSLGDRKVCDVDHRDIAELHGKMFEHPAHANRARGVISKMFNLAEFWGWRPENTNPTRKVKKYREKRRMRPLKTEEAIALGKLLLERKNYPDENLAAIYAIQLLLLTGCRSGEIRTLKWGYIDFGTNNMHLPDSKTGPKSIYLTAPIIQLLNEIKNNPARPADNPYVIWGAKENMPLNNLQSAWERFRGATNLDDVRLHDLRHSYATFATGKQISLKTIGGLLGHADTKTTEIYAHTMDGPMRASAEDVANHIGDLLGVPKVAPLPTTAFVSSAADLLCIPKTRIPMPQYLTSDQAALYLGLEPRSMKDWRYRKLGPRYQKIGNRIRYCRPDLDEYRKVKTIAAS